MQSYVTINRALARASAEWPPEERAEVLAQSYDQVIRSINNLKDTVHCEDYRIASACTTHAWLCLLQGCPQGAEARFRRVIEHWADRGGVRRVDAWLGLLASIVELDYPDEIVRQHYNEFLRLASDQISVQMIALELNRVGVVAWRAGLLKAAKYMFCAAIELYPSQNYGKYKPTARDNLRRLKRSTSDKAVST